MFTADAPIKLLNWLRVSCRRENPVCVPLLYTCMAGECLENQSRLNDSPWPKHLLPLFSFPRSAQEWAGISCALTLGCKGTASVKLGSTGQSGRTRVAWTGPQQRVCSHGTCWLKCCRASETHLWALAEMFTVKYNITDEYISIKADDYLLNAQWRAPTKLHQELNQEPGCKSQAGSLLWMQNVTLHPFVFTEFW